MMRRKGAGHSIQSIANSLALGATIYLAAAARQRACGQLVSHEREAALRALLPAVDEPEMQSVLHDSKLLVYTEREMPKAYQHAGGVHSPYYNIAANPDTAGNANNEFPWKDPAGLDRSRGVPMHRFVYLPRRPDGTRWPVIWWQARLPNFPGAAESDDVVIRWRFPVGAVVGEVLCVVGPDGRPRPFELRTRTREANAWAIEVYRPYPSPEALVAKIRELRPPSPERDALIAEVLRPIGSKLTIADSQPRRRVFKQTAGVDVLPAMDAALVSELLDQVTFSAVSGRPWKVAGELESHAPTSTAQYGIVPANYDGHAVPVNPQSCTRCHETTLRHAEEFAINRGSPGPGFREWYGRIRGSDGIFSFHPFEPRSISTNGASLGVEIRASLVQGGVVAQRDLQKHPSSVYSEAPDFEPGRF